jgi:hypothetical protein
MMIESKIREYFTLRVMENLNVVGARCVFNPAFFLRKFRQAVQEFKAILEF